MIQDINFDPHSLLISILAHTAYLFQDTYISKSKFTFS